MKRWNNGNDTNGRRKSRNARQIRDSTVKKINNYYTNQIEECKKKIEKMDRYINNVSMTNVVVGKTNDGSKNITLADIWPDDEKTRN